MEQPAQKAVDDENARLKQREEKRKERAELREKNQDILIDNTRIMFENISNYLKSELSATSADYKLLQQMNVVTRDKYVEMTGMVSHLVEDMTAIQAKYKEFQPYLHQIDEIDANVVELERTVLLLDEYTKRIEAKFLNVRQQQQQQQQVQQQLQQQLQQQQRK
eukprot:TRINITY_DN1476_c0_g1_i6.p1 TRINITY_DN1476_c0_g1~~TRINITY_DN1476_c0_g1_i6.p1  ORF type:complete len:177 (-),score=55.88 TRINITY_DN1476_c0_g1_i6:157-648(-)